MSDIHGCVDEFERALEQVLPHLAEPGSELLLLGDYVHGGPASFAVIDRIMELQSRWPDKVVALRGNHEQMMLEPGCDLPMGDDERSHAHSEREYRAWLRGLPLYHVEGHVIFVHAGIDERAGDLWRWGTDETTLIWKYPAQIGRFEDGWAIVAGHVSTATVSGDPAFHDIFFDGEAHYYIDGDVLVSGRIPILLVDTAEHRFYEVSEDGERPISPYGRDNVGKAY
ncbi:metallophosphoesterase [Coriobacterium glomerans PW2]|uniref:Metallophosphoesterase n=1 Tax=Coriobacterium glomerans (strain ATCC 49209 / DSM 20642 / JCM 10262 / PW2) TaxID=700015 RepID=F2N9L1_CORGP|nr:metallophosphoesterase family protein [Coriobacterium glomerans]AEB07040.1 metallophosphoesterase [Coriobacterium glomerans PW2]